MNQELSTTEAKQVEQAANDYLVRCKHYGSPSATPKDHFEAGIEYALKELLPGRMKDFAHWMDQNEWTYIGEELWVPKDVDGFRADEVLFKDMLLIFIRENKKSKH